MLISVLVSVAILMLMVTGGAPTFADLVLFTLVAGAAFVVVVFIRNRFADGLVNVFLGGGAPPTSAAALMTDTAEGFVRQQEYDAALYEYEQALRRAKGPQRARLMLRLAETAVMAEHPDEALRWWRESLAQKKGLSDEERACAQFRMAEVTQTHLHDVRGAAQMLVRVRDEYPGSKYASFAQDRLEAITANRAPS